MEKLAGFLADYVIRKGVVDEEERNIYKYGFVIAIEMGCFVIFCLAISLYFDMFIEGILFFVVFAPLRSYAGGMHLEKYHSCFILSDMTFSGVLWMVRHIQVPIVVSFIILLVLEMNVYILYPVENINRRVDKEENQYFKRRLKVFLFMDILVALVCVYLKNGSALFEVVLTFLVVLITMVIGKYKNRNI